jgi:glycosyltransferase involved in cell wall biosynthesis
MIIVILTETFTRRMGYIQTILPKYFARLGHEVHVITIPFPPYYQLRDFQETYGQFTGEDPLIPGMTESVNGYTLHVLAAERQFGYLRMTGLEKKLAAIRPDIVQTWASIGWIPMDAARLKRKLGYKLFTGNHNAMSTSRALLGLDGTLKQRAKSFVTRFISGRLASFAVERCYAVTVDCAEIAWRYYGVQKSKVEVMHLGVDTDYFYPARETADQSACATLRASLGLSPTDIVCIYSGKMTEDKNALILAQAIGKLREMGKPYSAVFIGNGVQKERIAMMPHCHVLDFMHFSNLAAYYRASEIGVWPSNESTSQLDAAACGIPIIISDAVIYRDHVERNGLVFHLDDLDDLVAKLLELESPEIRQRMGQYGAKKMRQHFSWQSVATRRLAHYSQAFADSGGTTALHRGDLSVQVGQHPAPSNSSCEK